MGKRRESAANTASTRKKPESTSRGRKASRSGEPAPASSATPRRPATGVLPELVDVLVIGGHPSAYFAVASLVARGIAPSRLAHVLPPGERADDRLLPSNPGILELVPPRLGDAPDLNDLPTSAGLCFLADTPPTRGRFVVERKPAQLLIPASRATDSLRGLADATGAARVEAETLTIDRVVDDGVRVGVNGRGIVARVLLLAADLPLEARRVLGVAESWEPGILHRVTRVAFSIERGAIEWPEDRTVPMSLDLAGSGAWAWMHGVDRRVQLSVQQPMPSVRSFPPSWLLTTWVDRLCRHGLIRDRDAVASAVAGAQFVDVPVAGALSTETVANRTLLFGPAGGFYSTCGEELYPACWSAACAADVASQALSARHVQDALQSYRGAWGTTLGDYLRGPQQNLTLLLPLIYKNAVMSARVGEAILFGESVVR